MNAKILIVIMIIALLMFIGAFFLDIRDSANPTITASEKQTNEIKNAISRNTSLLAAIIAFVAILTYRE